MPREYEDWERCPYTLSQIHIWHRVGQHMECHARGCQAKPPPERVPAMLRRWKEVNTQRQVDDAEAAAVRERR